MIAKQLPARHGLLWVLAAWQLLRRYPRQLTSMTLAYFSLLLVMNLIPYIGPVLLSLVLPSLNAMVGNACRALDNNQAVTQARLAASLTEQRVPLFRLGWLYLTSSLLILIINSFLLPNLSPEKVDNATRVAEVLPQYGVLLLLVSPLMMAFWFAPLLTAWHGLPAMKSIFFSFVASWRNWRAFTVYALVVTLVSFIAMIIPTIIGSLLLPSSMGAFAVVVLVMMILLLLIGPVVVTSMYISYRDVFEAPLTLDTSNSNSSGENYNSEHGRTSSHLVD